MKTTGERIVRIVDGIVEQYKSDLLVAQQALATEKMIAEMRRKERIELRAARDGLAQAAMDAEEAYQWQKDAHSYLRKDCDKWEDRYYDLYFKLQKIVEG